MNLSEMVEQAGAVFVLPDSVTRLKECVDSQSASIDDIAEIITYDPSLTSQLLKIANSSLYRFTSPIETVSKAIQVIGTRATFDLSLSYGVSHTFASIDGSVIDIDRFWEQSVSCALLAKYFGGIKRIRESEKLFVAGLLHNIGELAIVNCWPEVAKRCNQVESGLSAIDTQQKVMGFTYSDFSAALIKSWGLPGTISVPIAQIHFEDVSALDSNAQIVKLAYEVAVDNVSDSFESAQKLTPGLLKALKLKENDVEEALEETNLQIVAVMQLFSPSAFNIF